MKRKTNDKDGNMHSETAVCVGSTAMYSINAFIYQQRQRISEHIFTRSYMPSLIYHCNLIFKCYPHIPQKGELIYSHLKSR